MRSDSAPTLRPAFPEGIRRSAYPAARPPPTHSAYPFARAAANRRNADFAQAANSRLPPKPPNPARVFPVPHRLPRCTIPSMRPLALLLLLAVLAQTARAAEPPASPTWPLWDGAVARPPCDI
jgi:hypothetical protein